MFDTASFNRSYVIELIAPGFKIFRSRFQTLYKYLWYIGDY